MKSIYIFLVIFFSLFILNCQTTEIIFSNNIANEAPDRKETEKQTYASLGLGIYEYTKPKEASCGNDVEKLIIKRNAVDATIYFLIGGIYTQRSIYVYCKDKLPATETTCNKRRTQKRKKKK